MEKILINGQEITLEYVVSQVFDAWVCRKTKPVNTFVKHIKEKPEYSDHMMCILSTNPYTGDTQAMMAGQNRFGDGDLCVYGEPAVRDSMMAYSNIAKEVINRIFGMTSEYDSVDEMSAHIAIYGRQFMALMESLKDEIISMCIDTNFSKRGQFNYIPRGSSGFELDIDTEYHKTPESVDEWFNEAVMMREAEYDNTYNKTSFREHEYDGDQLIRTWYPWYEDYDQPFQDPVEILISLVWDRLNPQFVKYTEIFGSIVDLPTYDDDADYFEYIRKYCADFDMFKKMIMFGKKWIDWSMVWSNDYSLKRKRDVFNDYCEKLMADVDTLDKALGVIKYWDEYLLYLQAGLKNALEY